MNKPWNHCCRDALRIYANRDAYAYLYGANGEKPTTLAEAEALVNRLWAANPAHFAEAVTKRKKTKKQLAEHIKGKVCLDCSAFVCYVTQEDDFSRLRVKTDYNSAGLIGRATVQRTPAAGTAGSVLWRSGHVALDVGYGLCVDFGNEFEDCRLYPLAGEFVKSGELPWVDYTGSSAR